MGLQDRDYYWEKRGGSAAKPKKQCSNIKYLLYPAFAIGVLWYGTDTLLRHKTASELKEQQTISGGIVLQADKQGHFRGIAIINNVPMPFMIDTGATRTVIPRNLAIAARLPLGKTIQSSTAGGQVYDQETKIGELRLGNALIRNVDASINAHLNEVLIGMNTLRYFKMVQNQGTLTLYGNAQGQSGIPKETIVFSEPVTQQEQPQVAVSQSRTVNKTFVKTVTCNNNVCKTSYSDH